MPGLPAPLAASKIDTRHLWLLMSVNLVWGFNFVLSKWGLADISATQFTSLRFLFLLLLLLPFLRWVPGAMVRLILIAVLMGAIAFIALFSALKYTESVSSIAIVLQLHVPMAALFSMAILREHVSWQRWVGILTALAGVGLMTFDPAVLASWMALLLALVGAGANALALPLIRSLGRVNVWNIQAWIALVSVPALLLWAKLGGVPVWQLGEVTTIAWWAVAYNVLLVSLVGHGLLYYLAQTYPISLVTPFTMLTPVLGVVFAVLLLNEPLTWPVLCGGLVTMLGVAVVYRS